MLQLNPERLSHIAGPGRTLLLTVKDRAAAAAGPCGSWIGEVV